MMNRLSHFLSLVVLVGMMASCAKKVEETPIPVRGPSDLTGHLTLLDQFQNDSIRLSRASNIAVTVTGANNVQATAALDTATGIFTFPALPAGIYTISYSADGFATIRVPGLEHFGGDKRVLPRSYTYQLSDTKIDGIRFDTVTSRVVTSYSLPLSVPADSAVTVRGTVVFPRRVSRPGKSDTTVFDIKSFARDSVLRFPVDTNYTITAQLITITKQLRYRTTLNQTSSVADHQVRGYVAYFSDDDNVSSTNYKFRQVSPDTTGRLFDVFIPIQQFINAGIIKSADSRTLHVSIYGTSGDKNWYGANRSETDANVLILPGLNPNPDAAKLNLPIVLPAHL